MVQGNFRFTRHEVCDDGSLVGLRCTCPPECTETRVGDGARDCDPGCRVCSDRQGRLWKELWGGRKPAGPVDVGEDG